MTKRANFSHSEHVRNEVLLYARMGVRSYKDLRKALKANQKAEMAEDELTSTDPNRRLRALSPKRLNSLQKTLIRAQLEKEVEMAERIDQTSDEVWHQVHVFLDAAAMVSKFLWGESTSQALDRRPARKHFKVEDDSVLADRSLRNHFQHFDERLETWEESRTEPGVFIDRWIHYDNDGPIVHFKTNTFTDETKSVDLTKDSFRFLNSLNMHLHYQSEVYDLEAIYEELFKISNTKSPTPEVGNMKASSEKELRDFLKGVEVTYRKRPSAKDVRAYMKRYE